MMSLYCEPVGSEAVQRTPRVNPTVRNVLARAEDEHRLEVKQTCQHMLKVIPIAPLNSGAMVHTKQSGRRLRRLSV